MAADFYDLKRSVTSCLHQNMVCCRWPVWVESSVEAVSAWIDWEFP